MTFKIKESLYWSVFLSLSQCWYHRTIWYSRHYSEKNSFFDFELFKKSWYIETGKICRIGLFYSKTLTDFLTYLWTFNFSSIFSGKSKKNLKNFRKLWKWTVCFTKFGEKKPFIRNLNCLSKKTLFLFVKSWERVNEYLNSRNKYGGKRDSNPPPSASEPLWQPTHAWYKTLTLHTWTLRVMGNFRNRKKTPTRLLNWNWIVSFRNFRKTFLERKNNERGNPSGNWGSRFLIN